MSNLTEDQARTYMHKLLAEMHEHRGSDLFIANDFPPSMKAHGAMQALANQKLTGDVTHKLAGLSGHRIAGHRARRRAVRRRAGAHRGTHARADPGVAR